MADQEPAPTQDQTPPAAGAQDPVDPLPVEPAAAAPGEPEPQRQAAPAPQEVPDPEAAFRTKYNIDGLIERSDAFDQLMRDPDFSDLYRRKLAGQPAAAVPAPRLTAEQLAEIQSDPDKFEKFVEEKALRIAQERFSPHIQQTQRQLDVMRREQDIMSTGDRHPDFWDLDQKGLIEPLAKKYSNLPMEQIYRIAAYDAYGWVPPAQGGNGGMRAPQPVGGRIPLRQGAPVDRTRQMVERPTGGAGVRRQTVRVKDREEAMTLALEAAKAGQDPPEFEIERS